MVEPRPGPTLAREVAAADNENQDLMSKVNSDCIFLHCLPANRSQEVSGEVIDGPQSYVWQEAQNRLHVQKELLLKFL